MIDRGATNLSLNKIIIIRRKRIIFAMVSSVSERYLKPMLNPKSNDGIGSLEDENDVKLYALFHPILTFMEHFKLTC